jgi:hypothetical protein
LFIVSATLAAVWCVFAPFYWAYNTANVFELPYGIALRSFLPQLLIAVVVVACLSVTVLRKRIAFIGFVVAAALAPTLALSIGNASSGVWPVTTVLLLLVAWRYRCYLATQA